MIAEHMVVSKKTIPHYSYIDECDVSEMVALRNELKRPFYAEGVKLTSLPFYVKAVVAALQRVPLINASLDEQAGEIVLHDAVPHRHCHGHRRKDSSCRSSATRTNWIWPGSRGRSSG